MGYAIGFRDQILNHVRGTQVPAPPANWSIALLTANPTTEDGAGLVEVSTGTWTNYARATVPASTAAWNAPQGGATAPQSISNAADISFGTAATTGNVTVTGIAIYNGATLTIWAALTASKIVQNGDPVVIPAGSLTIQQ